MNDIELLKEYVRSGSEDAFAELARQHIGLVYSAALRQVNGDAALAQEIAQTVFSDLARKARRLTGHTSLAGWLFTSTRYLAANARRAEQRRRRRELEAAAMNTSNQTNPEPAWSEIRPVLDEAVHELNATDREAVLLRYFEQRPLAEISTRLGLSEDAARMRIHRALEKLRETLRRRGLTSTAATLAGMLTAEAAGAPPPAMLPEVVRAALAEAASRGGTLAAILPAVLSHKGPLVLGILVGAMILTALLLPRPGEREESLNGNTAPGLKPAAENQARELGGLHDAEALDLAGRVASSNDAEAGTHRLRLRLIAAHSGKPIPNGLVEIFRSVQGSFEHPRIHSDDNGLCEIDIPEKIAEIQLTTRIEGFADTRLQWRPSRGETIPEDYTLRLEPAFPIGGTVVDYRGNPVGEARVGFRDSDDPALTSQTESRKFSWVETITDENGWWQIDRIAEEMLGSIHGSARHPEHLATLEMDTSQEAEALRQLRDGTFVFRLGRAAVVQGIVVDPDGQPVPGARISVGMTGTSDRSEARSGEDGAFFVVGCKPGPNVIEAEAPGFAPVTKAIELAVEGANGFRLVLDRGSLLRIRVVNKNGDPIPGARPWLRDSAVQFYKRADEEGRVIWNDAPDKGMLFDVTATGYLTTHNVVLRPEDHEHIVVLQPGLSIRGTVRDARSGGLIPRFRIVSGWLRTGAGPVWSTDDRFWLHFEGGVFQHTFDELPMRSRPNPMYVFKFEADGYAPYISRAISSDEENIELQVELRRGQSASILVVKPDGKAAVDADVGLVSPGANISIGTSGIRRQYASGGAVLRTDNQGRFQLPPDDSVSKVVVVHPEGYGEATPGALQFQTAIQLRPWGSLTGVCLEGETPVSGKTLFLFVEPAVPGGLTFDLDSYRAETDADGRFAFPRVPPGRLRVARANPDEEGRLTNFSHSTEVQILAGETTAIALKW